MFRKILNLRNLTLTIVTTVYIVISKQIFDNIFLTSNIIVDEEFHLPLGEAYCWRDFNKWDPKVTTFPGLYLLSTLIFSSFKLCSTYWLRLTSFIAASVNIILFYMVLKLFNKEVAWKNVISAVNLSLLPPLYFFSHIYYTDVSSIMMTILMVICAKKECHYLASIFGFLAIAMRQTNVIWIGMLFGDHLLKELVLLISKNSSSSKVAKISWEDVQHTIKTTLIQPTAVLKRMHLKLIFNCSAYMSVICSFLIFVYLNGSIVVGDKTAHKATIHIPQIFYFATFTLVFGWVHFISFVVPFFKYFSTFVFVSIVSCLLIIYWNTLVHPYMLADNRHYIFYVWNRFYGRYYFFVMLWCWYMFLPLMVFWPKFGIKVTLHSH
ncbi:hypothetical protein HHI36_023144 [Cryptolaemus montrouzieri]|uniref:Dol-P-Glc:Glc(2)Man(9)GlcNAc(2)-PP-Dol alpha-1,2-glucosyltransferase n=1 Tax=Cryptolaemus montrouzieri TaxID=559131 RepID=A0ABD2PFK7_9CUCU